MIQAIVVLIQKCYENAMKGTLKRVPIWMRYTAAIISLFVLFLNYWNILTYVSWDCPPLWTESFRCYLNSNIELYVKLWLVYIIVIRHFLNYGLSFCHTRFDPYPLWFTIDDIIELLFSLLFLLTAINQLIEFVYGIYSDSATVCCIVATIYLVYKVFCYLYYRNDFQWECRISEYTPYYDCNGERIHKQAYTVYRGIGYRVLEPLPMDGKGEWMIESLDKRHDRISLREAVGDREGCIKVTYPILTKK